MKEGLQELANNPKVAASVATATTGTGIADWLSWIPDEIGKLATLIGIVLSLVLIYTHWRVGRINYRKTRLEIKILEEKEAERLTAAKLERRRHTD